MNYNKIRQLAASLKDLGLLNYSYKIARLATRSLRIFDFDDTLVKTKSRVILKKLVELDDGSKEYEVEYLTPAEYAHYEPQPDDEFDFSEFDKVINPQEIEWTQKILRAVLKIRGDSGAEILTARGPESQRAIAEYLKESGVEGINIITLGDGDPQKKADYIYEKAISGDYDLIEFFDDSGKNIAAVKNLPEVPGVKIRARQVRH